MMTKSQEKNWKFHLLLKIETRHTYRNMEIPSAISNSKNEIKHVIHYYYCKSKQFLSIYSKPFFALRTMPHFSLLWSSNLPQEWTNSEFCIQTSFTKFVSTFLQSYQLWN